MRLLALVCVIAPAPAPTGGGVMRKVTVVATDVVVIALSATETKLALAFLSVVWATREGAKDARGVEGASVMGGVQVQGSLIG